jgi:YHS domain-containing protein
MRCRVVSSLVLIAFLANSLFVHAADPLGSPPAGIPWAGTVRDGLKQALINQKQILLYFYAPDLAACVSAEQQVLGNADVQQVIAANYIPVKINVRDVPATAKFYKANDESQLPCVLILSADDKVVSRFIVNSNPSEFVAQVKAGVNTNPKLEQLGSLAKSASSYLAPTAEPTALANAALVANTNPNKLASAVTPTAWQPGTTAAGNNALLLPEFAPNNTASTAPTTPAAKNSLLPPAAGPLARTSNGDVTFGGAPATNGTAAAAPAIPNLVQYGMASVPAPNTTAAPMGYGMQNLAATAQPYQQQAQQTAAQWQNTANQTYANAQTQANQAVANAQTQANQSLAAAQQQAQQQMNNAQQQLNTAQQNLQNKFGAATNNLASAAPAAGSFYDAGLSSRPSATQGAGLATVPGLGNPPANTGTTPSTQPAGSPYNLSGVAGYAVPTTPALTAPPASSPAAPAAATPPTNFALAPGASYGIPNNAPPAPALPGHPKEKAGLANYSTDNLQGYLGNGSKPALPSAQVNAAVAAKPAPSSAPPVGNYAAAAAPSAAIQPQANPTPQIGLQGHCPVTIAEAHKWAKGDPQFGAAHRGKTYLFATAAEQQKFLAAPDKYSPVIGGNDPVVMFHEGRYIAGTPALGAMYKSRMYLFSTPAAKTEFEANPTKYEQAVSVAETQAGIIVR